MTHQQIIPYTLPATENQNSRKEKGCVSLEKPFQYIEEQFVKGRSFATMEELNAAASDFIKEWNNTVHTTTKRIPDEYYLQEEKMRFFHFRKIDIM